MPQRPLSPRPLYSLQSALTRLTLRLLTPALRWTLAHRTDYELTQLARRLGAIFWCLFPKRRALGLSHLALALGETTSLEARRQLLRESYVHLALTALTALQRASNPSASGRSRPVRIIGQERLSALTQGGGVVFVSAHMGDWESLLTLHHTLDRGLILLSKRFSHPLAQALWDRSRVQAPVRFDEGARARALIDHLKAGGYVADVIDQHDPRPKARRLLFFGQEASTSPDALILAERGASTLIPLLTWRDHLPQQEGEELRHTVWIGEPISPQVGPRTWAQRDLLLSECLRQMEAQIRLRPAQWLWIHRRWKPRVTVRSKRQVKP